MFKSISRTLSALSIVTITASAGFAQSTSATDCAAPWNQDHEDCTVSTKIWLDDFASPIKSIGATNGADNGFVEFGTNGFNNAEGNLIFTGDPKRGKLNLKADVTQDDGSTVNETIGGVLFYRDLHMASSSYLYYAGIKSGTNLGRPLTDALVGASWSNGSDTWTGGNFKAVGGTNTYNTNKDDFELTVTFGGVTDAGKVGSISALVNLQGTEHYRIDGKFDRKGVITGTVTYGLFNASNEFAAPYTGLGSIDGTLSGLIGDQGAVGVFVSDTNRDSYGIYGFAGGFVVKSNFDAGEADLIRICVLNPFDSGCSDTKFDSLKIARIEHCVTDDNSATDITCVGAIGATGDTSCILNPFQTACKDANADYSAQYITARADRVAFCEQSANSENAVCQGDTIVAGVCGVNPFGEACEGDYDEAVNDWLIACEAGTAAADDPRCVQANKIIDRCTAKPFEDGCALGAFKDVRQNALKTCQDAGTCTGVVLEQPNAATWVNTVTIRAENPIVLGDGADVISPEYLILKNIESAEDNENIEIYNRSSRYPNPGTDYKSLNLETATFNISGTPDGEATPLGGDAEDGVATFYGRPAGQYNGLDSGNKAYAGIFSTTDLGAPLTKPSDNEPKTASWVGSFRRDSRLARDFVLEVNFDTQSIEAFVNHYFRYHYYLLKGDYDDNGVISGTVVQGRFIDNNRNKRDYRNNYSVFPLTGLIGKEGAVGVFVGDYNRNGGFVARPAEYVTGAVDYLDGVCDADDGNPFHQYCYLRKNARKAVIDLCITGKDVLNDNCEKAREHHSCLLHPFNEECKTAFTYYEIARENRSAFCNDPANTGDNFNTLCTDAEQVGLCAYDPFNRLCDNTNGLYNDARKAVCKAGFDHPDCATDTYNTTSNDVTAISWLVSIYNDKGVLPQTKPDTVRPRHQFLRNIEDAQTNTGIDIYIRPSYSYRAGTTYKSLNLNTTTFDGLELGLGKDTKSREDAADNGVALFQSDDSIRDRNHYLGIFSGTDLGAPLVETKTEMKFYGKFMNTIYRFLTTDFTLDINFNGESTGTVEAFINHIGNDYFLLKGDFDSNGVISGTVVTGGFANHNRDNIIEINYIRPTSVLTGLIGEEGAVGVFVGGRHSELSGGFVASSKSAADAFDPNVKYSDWVRSFGNPRYPTVRSDEPQQTLFLRGTATGLNAGYGAVPQTLTLALADGDLGGDGADGVAYVSWEQHRDYNSQTRSYDTITTHHYAGILSGTHLGAALPTVPAGANGAITAIWDGKLGLVANAVEIPKRDIKLTVDFTNKRISHRSVVGGAHLVNLNANWESGFGYDGVLKGTITYNPGAALDNLAADSTRNSAGIVTGIIGTEGAVGAFRSTHVDNPTATHTSYAGGFVAVPVVNHLNWVNSFDNPSDVSVGIGAYRSQQQTRFVQGTGTGLDTRFIDNSVLQTLTLANGDLGGEVADGVVYVSGVRNVYNRQQGGTVPVSRHFAGILSGTNLGAPLEVKPAVDGTDATANWAGKLGMIVNRASPVESSITLKVNYTKQNITLNRTAIGLGAVSFTNVGWDNTSGVLTGAITYDPNDSALADSTGKVTGLIGQQGAVGAFISDHGDAHTNLNTPYSGGFVAVPPAEPASP